jgi:hypothetical protein
MTDVNMRSRGHAGYLAAECDEWDAGLTQVGNQRASFGAIWPHRHIDRMPMIES